MATGSPDASRPELVRRPGGRVLAFEEFGDPDGFPVLYFHGMPGSRVSGRMLDGAATAAGVRLVAPDRPGTGASTYQQRRRIRDWPEDVLALATVLECDRFAVLGWRGGAAYALACAHDLPEAGTGREDSHEAGTGGEDSHEAGTGTEDMPELVATGLVSPLPPPSVVRASVGPLGRLWYDLVSYLPFARLPGVRRTAHRLAVDPSVLLREHAEAGSPADREALRRVGESQRAGHQRAFRQGVWGPLRDVTLQHRGWGFRPEGVTRHVDLRHGRADPEVPPEQVERLVERLPDCDATFYEDAGHFSVLVDHDEEILRALAAAGT